jgi:flagellar export protein FliJ
MQLWGMGNRNMADFKFRLQALLEYRIHQRDLCRVLLGEVLAEEQKILDELQHLKDEETQTLDEIRDLQQVGVFDPFAASRRRYHTSQLRYEQHHVNQKQQLIQKQIDLCRLHLIKADQAVKALEKMEDKQRRDYDAIQLKKTDLALEEAWQSVNLTGGPR